MSMLCFQIVNEVLLKKGVELITNMTSLVGKI